MEINFNDKLEITIRNEKPVVLTDLTLSLLAVNQQFQRFLESKTNHDYQTSTELYIKEVRSGSIVVELVALAMPIIPLVWTGGPLNEWMNQAKAILDWLLAKTANKPKDLAKADYNQWNSILEPVAKDSASQLNFSVSDNGRVINQFFINSSQANEAQNRIKRELAKIDEPEDHVHKKKVMTWYQTKFDAESHTGDKAVIESITKKPLKVIFDNNAVKEAMLKGDPRFARPWHELAYVVDVELQTINGVPKVYTVLNYHKKDTFDPSE